MSTETGRTALSLSFAGCKQHCTLQTLPPATASSSTQTFVMTEYIKTLQSREEGVALAVQLAECKERTRQAEESADDAHNEALSLREQLEEAHAEVQQMQQKVVDTAANCSRQGSCSLTSKHGLRKQFMILLRQPLKKPIIPGPLSFCLSRSLSLRLSCCFS